MNREQFYNEDGTHMCDYHLQEVDIYDEVTGEVTPAYLFVAVLPYSLYVYAELCRNMKYDTFINCHVHAYSYFGGSTRLLIPDNLKAGITKNTWYDTLIPRAYKEMAQHYNTAIVSVRVKHPDTTVEVF